MKWIYRQSISVRDSVCHNNPCNPLFWVLYISYMMIKCSVFVSPYLWTFFTNSGKFSSLVLLPNPRLLMLHYVVNIFGLKCNYLKCELMDMARLNYHLILWQNWCEPSGWSWLMMPCVLQTTRTCRWVLI